MYSSMSPRTSAWLAFSVRATRLATSGAAPPLAEPTAASSIPIVSGKRKFMGPPRVWDSPRRPASQLDADVLRLGEERERVEAALAADAALLHPAEGHAEVAQEPRVDPHGPGLDRRGDPVGLLQVPGPHARREAVARAVRVGDR